jgi:hypothetical protein
VTNKGWTVFLCLIRLPYALVKAIIAFI